MNDAISSCVFLGAPTVLTAKQQPYQEQWLEWLENHNLDVVRLQRGAYGKDPWRTLKGLLSQTDGVVLLGFRQLDARTATWRPHTKEETHSADWWTSPWLHFEAGMAVMSGLPLLVAADEGVEEGVFHPNAWDNQVHGTVLSSPGNVGMEWIELVQRRWILRKRSSRSLPDSGLADDGGVLLLLAPLGHPGLVLHRDDLFALGDEF